jgi:type IV secretory pathway VirB4 component
MAGCSMPNPSGWGSPVQAFETEGLTGIGCRPAVLAYLFHRIEGRLDGSPTLIIIDEGWLVLDESGVRGQLREWLKTLRKKNASVVFATQSSSGHRDQRHRTSHHRKLPDPDIPAQ